jgi:voltage-gated potassium channel Kch
VHEAVTILAVSPDDQLNLQTALRARDANPRIRIVLRQFNRTLAAKIEQNLPDCSVLSLAWHSAATYAAVGLDPRCLRGLQFPEPDGPLTGFSIRNAADSDLGSRTVAQAEHALGARVVAINGDIALDGDTRIPSQAEIVVYGTMEGLLGSTPRQPRQVERSPIRRRVGRIFSRLRRLRRIDPILACFILFALVIIAFGTWYFHGTFGTDWLTAVYFVLTTMTTTGYGDLTPDRSRTTDILVALTLMLSGVALTGIFFAFAASRLTRVQWVRMQGLRRVRQRGHIVICGAGSVGSGVIELLLGFDKPLVVIEREPDTALVERAREAGFDLLTGDASRDEALQLCNLAAAHSLIALTNVDTLNLEIALGARARNPDMPVVLRIAEATLAASIATHFDLKTTFSVAALAAPTFAGLARFAGARGRIAFHDEEFAIVEAVVDDAFQQNVPRSAALLAMSRDGGFELIHGSDEVVPGDRVLMIVPLTPFRDGSEPLPVVPAPVSSSRAASYTASSHQIGV